MQYSLPCSCGKTVTIETSQAGQQVTCECGQQLDVPTMREIRRLQRAIAPTAPQAHPKRRWSLLQRVLFAVGTLLLGAGFSVAAFNQARRLQLNTEEVAWDTTLETHLEEIENMSLVQAWTGWTTVRDAGVGQYRPPPFIIARFLSSIWLRYITIGLITGGVGALLMALAIFLPGRRAPARHKRPPATR